MLYEIRTCLGRLAFSIESDSWRSCLIEAVKREVSLVNADFRGMDFHAMKLSGINFLRADFRGADLRGTDLRSADLRGADLQGTNLRIADLRGATLDGANLREADLYASNLRGTSLRGADLTGADFRTAYLHGTDLQASHLQYANFIGANLKLVNFRWADLRHAKFSNANFCSTDLYGTQGLTKIPIGCQTCPPSGSFEGWKKGTLYISHVGSKYHCIIKLKIPWFARRTSCIGSRKCLAELALVMAIYDKKGRPVKRCYNMSYPDRTLLYRVGEFVHSKHYDPSLAIECSNGIHFFMTREEAEEWS